MAQNFAIGTAIFVDFDTVGDRQLSQELRINLLGKKDFKAIIGTCMYMNIQYGKVPVTESTENGSKRRGQYTVIIAGQLTKNHTRVGCRWRSEFVLQALPESHVIRRPAFLLSRRRRLRQETSRAWVGVYQMSEP